MDGETKASEAQMRNSLVPRVLYAWKTGAYTLTFKGHALYVQFHFLCLVKPLATHMGGFRVAAEEVGWGPCAPPLLPGSVTCPSFIIFLL